MKLTIVLLTAICVQVSAKTYSQKITITEKNASLEKVFKQIRKQTDYHFFYKDELLQKAGKVDIQVKNATIDEVLNECFKNQPFSYLIIEKTILIKTKKDPVASSTQDLTPLAEINGQVTDSKGAPLQGVSVTNLKTGKGLTTDASGKFSITGEVNDILEFSFVGYKAQKVKVTSLQQIIHISLQLDIAELSNTVVIGYGTVKKSDLTGAVSSVSSEKITQVNAVSNVAQALQGQAAGVQVNQASGQPGEGVMIKIRGTNSIGASNAPLYVVDGLPLDNLSNQLNVDDIANIEVLKDASSTAIYGSRGANGVIMITTKKGKEGKAKVTYSGYYGIESLRKKIKVIGASDLAELQNEVIINDNASGINSPALPIPWTSAQIDSMKGKGTDWQDETYKPSPVQNHDISISGGNINTKYYTSFGYFDQKGMIENTGFRRLSFRVNLDQKINKRFDVNSSLSIQNSKFNTIQSTIYYGFIPFQAMVEPSNQPIKDANGNYTVFTGVAWGQTNPVGVAKNSWCPSNNLRIIGNLSLVYELTDELKLKINAGLDNSWNRNDSYFSSDITFGQPGGVASVGYSNLNTFVSESMLSYAKKIAKHSIDAVGGVSYQTNISKFLNSGSQSNFASGIFQNNLLQAAANRNYPSSGYSNYKLLSYLGRINYNYSGKYYATITGRYDGSSVFGADNKFAFFPSAALAWKVSEENFLKNNNTISNFKLRVSYGSSGNQAINPYQSLPSVTANSAVLDNLQTTGYIQNSLDNRGLKWETTWQFDAGVDLGLYNNRVLFTADFYNKKTENLLLNVTLPPSSGFGSALQNIGSVQNRGYEFQLTTINSQRVIRWISTLSFSHNRTKVLDLGRDGAGIPLTYKESGTGGNWFPLLLGQSMFQLYGQTIAGVYQTDEEAIKNGEPQKHAGDFKFLDYNHDGVVDANDKHVLTHLEPKFTFGFNNNFSYKKFDLTLLFVGSYGNDVVNEYRKFNFTLNGLMTPSVEAFKNRWRGSGTSNIADKPSSRSSAYTSDYANSLWVENGSYFKLRDITLGYTFNTSKISSIKVYVSAQNMITITKYSGYDPEASWSAATINGWDRGVYPSMKSFTCGVKINF
ncbi:MAG: TonB-dependent receptor [Bacteroidetes bacterium]|nr:TonB-dependent receptor [Bacteroidota bacterium]MBS1609038.1 TonB-dependent receptor [Bacteroidota bacterium]